jgi:type IV pilus assembly protein PilN
VISVILGAILVGFVHVAIGTQISNQERRNEYLKQETAVLDRQIAEIRKLREQTDSLLARKNVVENLQSTRSDVVHLLDQMLRILLTGFISNLSNRPATRSIWSVMRSPMRVSPR